MAFLYLESDLLIGILYPDKYIDAVWMQKYLVVTILLSFVSNTFSYVMMVAGAARVLLAFALGATTANLLINVGLVYPLGLLGGCLVIILTKLMMTTLTFGYCQIRFRLFALGDFKFPVAAAALSSALYLGVKPLLPFHVAVGILLAFYALILGLLGGRFLGGSLMATRAEKSSGEE
jgi:O-antigen/teichoic acid export membrane protein